MNSVFLVQHSYETESGCDEIKLIGVYSNQLEAEKAVERLRLQPGFMDYPNCFHINQYELNEDHWREGFVRL